MHIRIVLGCLCLLGCAGAEERGGADASTLEESSAQGDAALDQHDATRAPAAQDDEPTPAAGPTGTDGSEPRDGGLYSLPDAGKCGNTLHATIRDFRAAHPDFENAAFASQVVFPGIVKEELGADQKPIYASSGATRQTTGPSEFAEWYNDVPSVNTTFMLDIALMNDGQGRYIYDSAAFFPVDGKGVHESNDSAKNPHNYHFTTEIHTLFEYRGGELFTFSGDDDVWVFINKRLAIDLGGLHRAIRQSVDLDASAQKLGITRGQRYEMDIFHAERMAVESNFRIETTIDCLIPAELL
jgi:fibro-slime domain-containing protein